MDLDTALRSLALEMSAYHHSNPVREQRARKMASNIMLMILLVRQSRYIEPRHNLIQDSSALINLFSRSQREFVQEVRVSQETFFFILRMIQGKIHCMQTGTLTVMY